jgi:hypothetical protein
MINPMAIRQQNHELRAIQAVLTGLSLIDGATEFGIAMNQQILER